VLADLDVGYRVTDHALIAVGANNLFNTYPTCSSSRTKALRDSATKPLFVLMALAAASTTYGLPTSIDAEKLSRGVHGTG